jgi:YfiH family protein
MAVQVLAVPDLGAGIRAGFTTRTGGASRGPWAAGNLGCSVGDDPAAVAANLADVSDWLGVRPAVGSQVHGRAVRRVEVAPAVGEKSPQCDGQIAVRRRDGAPVGLGVLAADCLPLLLVDPDVGVIATAHAGRRGLAAGVLQATVTEMVAAGAEPRRIRAVVGPGICGRCYEVPAGLQEEVAAVVPETVTTTDRGTPGLDLAAGARAVLTGLGVVQITDMGICTRTDDRFFSYRGAGGAAGPTGRFAGLIAVGRAVPG